MAMTLGTLRVDIEADVSELRRSEREVDQSSRRMSSSLSKIGVAAAAAGVAAAALAVNVIKTADNMRVMEASIKRLVGTTEDARKAIMKLGETASDTGISLDDASKIFQRFAASKEELGATNEQLLQMTDTLAKMGTLGGSSAEELSNALVQLSQGFSGGIIRAEEFNSIIEGAPEIIRQVGHSMGMSMGEVRQAMLDGELTAESMFDAILDSTERVDEEFSKLPQSITGAINAIKTQFAIFVRDLDTGIFVEVLSDIAKIIEYQNEKNALEERHIMLKKKTAAAEAQIADIKSNASKEDAAAIERYEQLKVLTEEALQLQVRSVTGEQLTDEESRLAGSAGDIYKEIYALEEKSEAVQKIVDLYDQIAKGFPATEAVTKGQPQAEPEFEPSKSDMKRIESIRQLGETEREEIRRIAEEKHEFLMTQTQLDAEELAELQQKINDDAMAALDASVKREQAIKDRASDQEKDKLEQLEEEKKRIRDRALSGAATFTGQLNDLMRAAGKEGTAIAKAIFLANKAIQVAEIITATHTASDKAGAWASTGGLAAYFSAKGAILATGYASAGIVAGTAVAETFGGGRQFGGSVSPMMAHQVNEAGVPELLEMGSKQYLLPTGAGGTISPLSDSSIGSPNVTIISNGTPQTVDNVSMTRGEIAVMISDMGRRTERRINSSLASGRGDTARSLQTGFKADRNLR